jgi:hypothetical protein
MDYAFDYYFTGDDDSEIRTDFIYDDRRSFSKVYIFCKYIGIVFYISTLPPCNKPILTAMVSLMFLSTANSARYEFAHYRRYGTRFSSIAEFETWKNQQYPKSRIVFALGELGLKIVYSITTFPPQFDFSFGTLCSMGESILNVHMLVIFMVYIIVSVCSLYLLYSGCCLSVGFYHTHPANRLRNHVQGQVQIQDRIRPLDAVAVAVAVSSNEECCICLDNENEQSWAVIPCGHKFHGACITRWVATQQPNCPVCRFDMQQIMVT